MGSGNADYCCKKRDKEYHVEQMHLSAIDLDR
jgi:hypothetical protein